MTNFYETVLTVLKTDERFVAEDGTFLRNAVYEAAMKMDDRLIRLLLANEETSSRFFVDVDGVKVFDKVGFAWVINNRQFLPDSYTRFKNKIGLADENGDLISTSGKVELVFPYKDCVLEGGQTLEEQKRQEVFYNQSLAPDEVDRLLFPKIFCNATRYSTDGETAAEEFLPTDNMVIKGNNLLSLATLIRNYEGQVKCIYIDPPYNTGKKNSFGYNDCFNHSTWLSFMKTRLEYARRLLSLDGCILIQTDDKEQAYLKVLCDEIFGAEQYETTFFVQVRFTNKTLAEDSTLHKVMETVHVYSKKHEAFRINKIKEQYSLDKFCWEIRELGEPKTIEVGGKTVDIFTNGKYEIIKVEPHIDGLKETWATGSLIRQGGTAAEFLAKYLIDRKKEDGLKVLYKVYNMGEDGLGFRYILGPQKESAFRGKFYSGVPLGIKNEVRTGVYDKEKPVPNLIYNYLSSEGDFGNCRNEGGVDIEGGKKPEQLIKFFLDYFSDEEDLVLDFFGGSGTTAAVAHKMNRRYITCEQMDNQIDMILSRLSSVITGEKAGISSDVDWQGGGSFVYCELAKLNQSIVEEVEAAADDAALSNIYSRIIKSGFISYRVNPADIDAAADDYAALSLDDKKRFLMEILDKNLLYVNYCDIDDEEFGISDEDKAFTRSFYREG
ncbi:site-specific DNA-methyltransferase [bacterium 0.1xD8-71]|nr:site-specific DNA-methyltransferase [bacterium 0.1xD8-71]